MRLELLELEQEYTLIGIHTSVEDYRLAYLLNKDLGTTFSRFQYQLDFKNNNASYTVYEHIDTKKQQEAYLISNKYLESVTGERNTSIFPEFVSYSTTNYLIPEKKKIDFFLKIEGEISKIEIKKTLLKLNNIHQIITSYNINPFELKSKGFLIF